MSSVQLDYLAAGGNRHPSAADWKDTLLVFGAGRNIALWNPLDPRPSGIRSLLSGHTDTVNAIRLLSSKSLSRPLIISGAADKTVRIWLCSSSSEYDYQEVACLKEHEGSVNTIAVTDGCATFATGAADATLRIWKINVSSTGELDAKCVQTIGLKPRYFPLTTAITPLSDSSLALAVAGTSAKIQIYVVHEDNFILGPTLTGHEGWIRSLDFVKESNEDASDLLLASASQDKYIRLWRIHRGAELPPTSAAASDPALGVIGRSLSNKPHYFGEGADGYSVTFEALLIGHEDWIYTTKWHTGLEPGDTPRLLSASADNSLAIWDRDAESGLWICTTRLGEISAQKGSTSATGSTGGFWVGLWSSDGTSVTSLGRTGGWRVWSLQPDSDMWHQQIGISGHTKEVRDLAWAIDGSYLLSTSADQTTRFFGQYRRKGEPTWHELSRPQIHGYDLNCLDVTGDLQFISGADEKLLRVFSMPGVVLNLVNGLAGTQVSSTQTLPDAANMPVLGLSNKAITTDDEARDNPADGTAVDEQDVEDSITAKISQKLKDDQDEPPFEDQLARYTLWPEHEKLYGHGYEISAVASSHDRRVVATACRASSLEHAVVRLYETAEWRELKPSLQAHSLTVTALQFSPDDRYLLTVGRDRQWALFKRQDDASLAYKLFACNPKGHSRMILDCAWSPKSSLFATAGRDKSVKIWRLDSKDAIPCVLTIPVSAPATAIAFEEKSSRGQYRLACGTEDGNVTIFTVEYSIGDEAKVAHELRFSGHDVPSGAINALAWRPFKSQDDSKAAQLAVGSDDSSVRLFTIPSQELSVEE